ncbi:MAG: hypothetical protein JJ902_09075 [Roseibium sp.]|nr:hypothetical protein [Roseibium sp.]
MNRIVKRHYPVDKLPEDLRAGLASGGLVSVTVEEEAGEKKFDFDRFKSEVDRIRGTFDHRVTGEAAAQRVRSLRDEWDD